MNYVLRPRNLYANMLTHNEASIKIRRTMMGKLLRGVSILVTIIALCICVNGVGQSANCTTNTECGFNEECKNICTSKRCQSDADCPDNATCLNYYGASGATSSSACVKKPVACTTNEQCDYNEECKMNVCVVKQCQSDANCPDNTYCAISYGGSGATSSSACVKKVRECTTNEQCEFYEYCIPNVCITKFCQSDNDCPETSYCFILGSMRACVQCSEVELINKILVEGEEKCPDKTNDVVRCDGCVCKTNYEADANMCLQKDAITQCADPDEIFDLDNGKCIKKDIVPPSQQPSTSESAHGGGSCSLIK